MRSFQLKFVSVLVMLAMLLKHNSSSNDSN